MTTVEFKAVVEPYAEVGPYATWDVEATLVFQVIVAEEEVMLAAAADDTVSAGLTVTAAVLLAPAYVAVSVTFVGALTPPLITEKEADVAPAGMPMEDGTEAADPLELASVTTAPPALACEVSVTAPVAVAPAATVVGLTEIPARAAAAGGVVVEGAQESFVPVQPYSNAPASIALTAPRVSPQAGWTYSYAGLSDTPAPVPASAPALIAGEPAWRW